MHTIMLFFSASKITLPSSCICGVMRCTNEPLMGRDMSGLCVHVCV